MTEEDTFNTLKRIPLADLDRTWAANEVLKWDEYKQRFPERHPFEVYLTEHGWTLSEWGDSHGVEI